MAKKESTKGDERIMSPNNKTYRERKARLQAEWRGRIFERDGFRCRACGREGTDETLHLTHVTPALRFVREAGSLEGMDASYREDNLVTLCGGCHKLQHRQVDSDFNPELTALLAKAEEMRKRPELQEWLALRRQIDKLFDAERLDARRRRARVETLFREILDTRAQGWKSPQGLEAIQAGVPSWESLGYRPSVKCKPPSEPARTKKERAAQGLCMYTASTCQGPPTRCEDCGLPFCTYHAPTHRRRDWG